MGRILLTTFFICFIFNKPLIFGEEKVMVGKVEKVIVFPLDLKLNAKIDTGAKNSSINALILKHFKNKEKHGLNRIS